MLVILSDMNLLLQPVTTTLAVVAWFGLLLGRPQVARRVVWQLFGGLLMIAGISCWLVPAAYQVSVTSTALIVSLFYIGRYLQPMIAPGVILLDAIVSSLLATWVYNVAVALLSLLTAPLVIQLCGYLLAGAVTVLVAVLPYWSHFEWLTASFFQNHPWQLGIFLGIALAIRGLNDYLAYLLQNTAYQGSVGWEMVSLLCVLIIILLPLLRHQYELLTCKLQ